MGHVRGIVLQKAQNNPASKAARSAFFAKGAKNAFCKERAKRQNQNPGRGISQTLSFFSPIKAAQPKPRVV
ncbi:MAG: hypothetical protein H7834_04840 [Magnetococcus sp. YQC-9]